ncbi:MAG TPA: peptidylprolyl isomerase [Planctomycetota bacterium]|nr:peptidylprolyl isomerase [Planctomycetota bacterium]
MRRFLLAAALAAAPGACRAPDGAAAPPELAAISLAEDARRPDQVVAYAASRDPAVRARVARALGRCGDRATIGVVATLAQDVDRDVALEGLFALGLLGVGDQVRVASDLARHPDPERRAYAIEALGRSGDATYAFAVAVGLQDPDPLVRSAAALAVFRLAGDRRSPASTFDPKAAAGLADLLARAAVAERADDVRVDIVYALASIRTPASRDPLLALAHDPASLVRLFAIRGLGKQAIDDEVVSALDDAARDPDERVAIEAAVSIRRLECGARCPSLASMLERNLAATRRAAVRAMTPDRFAAELDRAEKDVSPSVRAEVAPARGTEAALEAALRDPHPLVRAKAAEACRSLPLLERALADPGGMVVASAATALGSVKDARSKELLARALQHPRGLVRENAAEALEKLAADLGPSAGDAEALLASLATCRGEDLAESRSSLVAAIPKVAPSPLDRTLQDRLKVALVDQLSDPDPTVRAKAVAAWRACLPSEAMPDVLVPPPVAPAIPGVNAPAFTRPARASIRTTRGTFTIVLFVDEAPVHAENFLRLAEMGRYEGTPFHRVELNFVVQGGDHLGDGTGARSASGGNLRDEIDRRRYLRGTVGMPKSDVPDSGGSQLFVMQIPAPHLDGRYTAFASVTSGLDVIDALEPGDRIDRVDVTDRGR